MKKPELKDLRAAARLSDPVALEVVAQREEASKIERKTFTLERRHLEHINAEAAKLQAERGKPVNASEALRTILERDMGAQGR